MAAGAVVPSRVVRERASLDGATPLKVSAAAALGLAPWVWPDSKDDPHWAGCEALGGKPPLLQIGDVPLLTVHSQQSSIWLHRFELDSHPTLYCAVLGKQAEAAVERARAALTRTARLFWGPEPWQHGDSLVAVRLDLAPASGVLPLDRGLDGGSIGLSMYLSMVSYVYGVVPRGDTIALADLDAQGRVKEVGGLSQKFAALARLAPRLRRVLVYANQRPVALNAAKEAGREHCGDAMWFDVLGVKTVLDAADRLLDDATVTQRLVALGQGRDKRERVIRQLFTQALLGRSQVYHWGPVEDAADMALKVWPRLARHDKGRLELVRMVAGRYAKQPQAHDPPSTAWITGLAPHTRAVVLAQHLQQAHDFGADPAQRLRPLVDQTLEEVGTSMPAVRLRGARARLWARDGALSQALAENRQLARLALELLAPGQASYSLAEWVRLAGALGHQRELEQAIAFEDELEDHDGLGPDNRPYVDLAVARALVLTGQPNRAVPRLRRIVDGPEVPGRTLILASALRWQAAAGFDGPRALGALAAMEDEQYLEDEQCAVRTVRVLAELDGRRIGARKALASLEGRWGALARRIVTGRPKRFSQREWLRRGWPY